MTADSNPDGTLFDLYRRYIGEPENRTDVYGGFGLFVGGIALALLALTLFVVANRYETTAGSPYWSWAQAAYALGMLSLPVTMIGVVTLLPAERRVRGVSAAGVAVTVGAVVGFVAAYPSNWNNYGADYTLAVVGGYALGLAAVTAATGAALIAHYLDMARAVEAVPAEEEAAAESYSDEEIRDDIDAAMEGVELSWGGVEKTEHKRLSFSEHQFDDADVNVEAKTTRSSGVDAQVAGLKGLKGGDTKTATSSSTVDDQTAKLKELREKQRLEEVATADSGGFVASARVRLNGVVEGVRAALNRR
ncbi:DUF7139 domain-containing protein [Natrononativus amylolyticus]|uniref:DUF7139 domain-containing protein n=1 Tax=Natrononativus amylolyticus TaxID=2963434 RepID=UPI0020CD98BF|nr:permease [Natrononativus amylolyticus]